MEEELMKKIADKYVELGHSYLIFKDQLEHAEFATSYMKDIIFQRSALECQE